MLQNLTDYFASYGLYEWLEVAAMILGVIYVFYEILKSRKMWYYMIVASIVNILVYTHNGFPAMVMIQFYYIVSAIYSIIKWTRVRAAAIEKYGYEDPKKDLQVAIVKMNPRKAIISSLIAVAVFILLASLLSHYAASGSEVYKVAFAGQPWWDAFIAVGSMLATYWLSQSYYEQWYLWMVINVVSVVVFYLSGMPWMALLYAAYIVMVIIGMITWRRHGVYVDEAALKGGSEG